VGGQPTNEIAIVVLVVKKKSPAELAPGEMIPAEVNGVKTDVVEVPIPSAHQTTPNPDTDKIRPLVGGIQISGPSGSGTLGCLCTIASQPNKVFALTNYHVAGFGNPKPTNMRATLTTTTSPATLAISTADGAAAITPPGSVVRVSFTVPGNQIANFWIQTVKGDTPAAFAQKVADRINAAANPAFNATVAGAVVTLNRTVAGTTLNVVLYSRQGHSLETTLQTEVAVPTITFKGTVNSDFYGIFTMATLSGLQNPSRGSFVPTQKDQAPEDIATAVAASLSDPTIGLNATKSGATVTVTGADHLDSYVVAEIRVGQSDAQYSSQCCDWCADTIGKYVAASYELEAAIIQLDPGLKYRGDIKDIGPITGNRALTPADVTAHTPLQKRGRTSRLTQGTLFMIHTDGFVEELLDKSTTPTAAAKGKINFRYYTDVFIVQGAGTVDISQRGDSGSVWLDGTTVVGLNFAGSDHVVTPTPSPSFAYATDIPRILTTFGMQIVTQAAGTPDQVVPGVLGARSVRGEALNAIENLASNRIRERIRKIEEEVVATPAGKDRLDLFRRHIREAANLVNRNRRVGVAWQRNGGPLLIKAAITMMCDPKAPIPSRIMDRPLDDCLTDIFRAIRTHSSAELASDLEQVAPFLLGLGGLNYRDALDHLCAPAVRQHPPASSDAASPAP